MPGFAAGGGFDREPRVFELPPFQEADLKAGAVYALGIETAAARLPLLLVPLQAALWAGRPCVLITRLDPQQAPFADVLAQALRMVAASGGGAERLQVFTAIGDYEVNLFLHGAERYLQELEQFEIAPGSLLLIDEADDLYTPHDHAALVQQARAYQSWCERGGHTMVQLHLRTGAHRPLLEGNQAAAQYLAGMARVTSHADGLAMVIDFWETASGLRTGSVVALRPLLAPFGRTEAALPPLWYVGQRDADLENWRREFDVRTATSLAELLPWRGDDADAGNDDSCGKRAAEGEGLSIIVTLTSLDRFAAFVEQLTALRAAVGRQARIVVRESRYRLREHTQKRLLLRVGVDSIWPTSQSLEDLMPLLKQPRMEPVAEWVDGNGNSDTAEPWALEAPVGEDAGCLCGSAFVDEVERRMRPGVLSRVPCALAEVDFEGPAALDAASAAKNSLVAGRKGDLTTATGGAQFFFLQGCRGRDVVHVVTRCMEDELAHRIRRIHLYTGESAIADRLLQLRQQADAEALLAIEPEDKTTNNVVSMPAAGRAGQARGHVSIAWLAAVAAALAWPAGEALAQGQGGGQGGAAMVSPTVAATSAQAYERGDYAEAARLGLTELQRDTANPELRLRVANSLAWTGQYAPAIRQYESLADTPLAAQASIGLGNVYLWSGRAHLADPLYRRALNADPTNADALQGLAAAARQLRPRTTVRGEWLDDSSRTDRSTALVSHRWRDAGLAQIFEVSGERVDESREPDGPDLQPRKLSFGYQNLGWAGAPKLQLTSDTGVKSSVYGKLGVQLAEGAVTVEIGRVNWGELAFDPNARRDGLSARRLGVAGRADAGIGAFSGSAAHFSVSDGNRVHEFNGQYTPAWQPFPAASGLRALVGVYGRKSERRDPRYWSPTQYYVGQIGLSLNRSGADWDLGAELKRSLRIGGDGTQGWTVGLTGTRWLSRDWALRVEGFHIETRRDDSAYRAKSVAVSLDRVW